VPLHEWVEGEPTPPIAASLDTGNAALERWLQQAASVRGSSERPITWLFHPDSFEPMAKLVGDQSWSIVTDRVGVPRVMVDENGAVTWSAKISTYGELQHVEGERHACPFRFQGQYEDAETGLYYNRHRYYDPASGQYISQDPIGLDGGRALHAYVTDPLRLTDPLGLAPECPKIVGHSSESAARRAALREAGIPAGTPPSRSVPSNPGSQAASGPRGARAEWDPVSDADVGVHHDPNGHRFSDESTIAPHYGVDNPRGPTTHHTYPSSVDPRLNR
jgi:RHS repeat-associated protein